MHSTDQNLNNPSRVDEITMHRVVEAVKFMKVEPVTQDFYDHIAVPDPHTCYPIIDSTDGRVYYGTVKVVPTGSTVKYLITQRTLDEWILVVNTRDAGPFGGDNLSEVCRYDDLDKAASAMAMYNRVGSHASVNIEIYNIIQQYIAGDIDIISCILGIFVVFGYKEDPMFQRLIQVVYELDTALRENGMIKYGTNDRKGLDITAPLREEILRLANAEPSSIFALFNKFYNVFVMFKFFQDPEYHKDPSIVNLSEPVDLIVRSYSAWKWAPCAN